MTAAPNPDQLLELKEAAEEAGCHYFTVWRAVRDGHLPSTRRGPRGRYKVRRRDLQHWNGDRIAGRRS